MIEVNDFTAAVMGWTPEQLEAEKQVARAAQQKIDRRAVAVVRLARADSDAWDEFLGWLNEATDVQQADTVPSSTLRHVNAQRVLYKEILRLYERGREISG